MESERNRYSPTHQESGELESPEHGDFCCFPEEIITEIILRLPVKSILKFRCVSKLWLSLISSQRFIKTHLNFSTNNSNLNGYGLIFLDRYPKLVFKQCSARSIVHEQTSTDVVNINYPVKRQPKYVWVVGCCNGLICIEINRRDLFLWNPAIKELTKLPSTDSKLKSMYGFGFDESNDDYKVMGIFRSFDEGQYTFMVKIYSLKTDSWKRIEDFKGGFPLYDSCKFANGKIYWLSEPDTVSSDLANPLYVTVEQPLPDIVSLDLANEVYETVEQPNYDGGKFETVFGVLDGCICVLCSYVDTRVNLWVLKERGVEGSWSKVFTATHDYISWNQLSLEPICTLPNGDFMFLFRPSFVVFDQMYNSFRFYEKMDLSTFSGAYIHAESLVSPAANGRLPRKHQ